MFRLLKTSAKSAARLGQLKTAPGVIQTPFFMPIATKAAVKNLDSQDLKKMGAGIILSNTYHLYLTPGLKVLQKAGGLHRFMAWSGPILTDSGGFQVFSLSKIRKILPGGVEFRSHLDGSKHLLTPKKVLQIQKIIGSDIAMILDVCPPATASRAEATEAVAMTTKWAKMAKAEINKIKAAADRAAVKNGESLAAKSGEKFAGRACASDQLFFAIIQGGVFRDLRLQSLADLKALDFDGYAIGGLAVGETSSQMYEVLDYLTPEMPTNKPRYLMGVGTPANIIEAVKRGVDMFDCVIPTREARHGRLYVARAGVNRAVGFSGPAVKSFETINIANAKFARDLTPINQTNLKNYSRAYLHHLFKTSESLGMRLATLNNLDFYLRLMEGIRVKIKRGEL